MADNTIANAIKFLKGEEKSLPAAKTEGQVYFAYKNVGTAEKPSYTGAIYIDTPIGGTQNRIKMTANADIAEYAKKANADSQGNLITGYLRNASLTGNADSQTFTFTAPSGAKFDLRLNGVNDSQAGLITSGDQIFPGYKTLKLRAKPSSIIGSDTENSNGWYKVATSTMSGWGNTNVLYYVKNGYSSEAVGILDFEMRSNNDSIQCWACKWLVRGTGFTPDMFRVVINEMTWTLYVYQPTTQYGRISITEISNIDINGSNPSYKITYYNSTTKETTEPDKKISSSDGGQVYLASKTTSDGNGQNIANTYIKSLSYSNDGKQLIATRGSGDTSLKLSLPIASTTKPGIVTTDAQSFGGTKTFTTINSTNLTVTGSSGFNYSGIETATESKARAIWFADSSGNGKPVINTNFTYNPATQTLKVLNLSGTAEKATKDSAGNDIRNTYVSDVTISGRTITVTKGSGAKVTLTTQDTDTWRGIQNNLTSDSTTDSLSAAQGKYLKSLIDGKSNNGHNHDDRYYTETEINSKLANYLPLSGGTLTGALNFANNIWNVVGDDVAIGDMNIAGTLGVMGKNGNTAIKLVQFGASTTGGDAAPGVAWTCTGNGTSTISGILSGTFNGNLSGNATSANKLNTNAGSATRPVYFSGGIPVQCNDTLANSISGNAATATKLQTARTITLAGSVTGSAAFDGSNNITITTSTNHSHSQYLPLAGGTMSGTSFITWPDSENWNNNNNNVTFPVTRGGLQWYGQSDYVKLFSQETGNDNLELVLQFGDDNSNGLSIRNYAGNETARITASGGFTGTFYGNLSGKASTAGTADVANSVAWSNISGKPGTFTPSSHTHTNIVSRGRKNPCASGTTGNNADAEVNVAGLSLTEAYSASTPISFGNIINVIGASAGGAGQLFLGWSGTDSVTEHLYYRSHRDTTTGGWGPWRTVAFTTDNVASADILTSNAGSATQPIYFSGGKPVACSYSLSKSVPSNAVFTDTNTWRGCQNNLTSTATDQSLSAAQGKWLNENKLNAINTNGYWGMATPSGNSGDWIRTTSAGIIPYQPGGINSSHCGLGTSSWYFNSAYITTVYGNLSGNASTASKLATARTVSGGTDIIMSFNYDGSGNSDANIGFYNCSAYVNDTNNYPFHRFAKLDIISNSWADKTTTFYVSQDFNEGAFGIFRISLRTNNVSNNELASAEVVWLVRHGIPADAIQIGLYNVAGATYADAFIKTQSSYYCTVFRAIANGGRGTIGRTWTLINSSESCNTSSSDKKGSYECYASVATAGTALHNKSYTNIVSGSDVGNVSYASSAGNATQWNGRTLDIGTEAGSNAGWLLIDDNGVVRHRHTSYFATASHTHPYLPLSGGTMTGNITYNKLGTCYIGAGSSDNVNMVGGGLNNLVISSWNGISFTTSCSSTFLNKNAVSIDCRNGVLATASLRVGNGSGSTINFCTNGGTANPGAKIVAYNDRIEFVFA